MRASSAPVGLNERWSDTASSTNININKSTLRRTCRIQPLAIPGDARQLGACGFQRAVVQHRENVRQNVSVLKCGSSKYLAIRASSAPVGLDDRWSDTASSPTPTQLASSATSFCVQASVQFNLDSMSWSDASVPASAF